VRSGLRQDDDRETKKKESWGVLRGILPDFSMEARRAGGYLLNRLCMRVTSCRGRTRSRRSKVRPSIEVCCLVAVSDLILSIRDNMPSRHKAVCRFKIFSELRSVGPAMVLETSLVAEELEINENFLLPAPVRLTSMRYCGYCLLVRNEAGMMEDSEELTLRAASSCFACSIDASFGSWAVIVSTVLAGDFGGTMGAPMTLALSWAL
jgi:hypothetical protein